MAKKPPSKMAQASLEARRAEFSYMEHLVEDGGSDIHSDIQRTQEVNHRQNLKAAFDASKPNAKSKKPKAGSGPTGP